MAKTPMKVTAKAKPKAKAKKLAFKKGGGKVKPELGFTVKDLAKRRKELEKKGAGR